MPQGWSTALPAILLATALASGLFGLTYSDYATLNHRIPQLLSPQKATHTEHFQEADLAPFQEADLAPSAKLLNLFGSARVQTAPVVAELPETRLNLTLKGTFTHQEDSSQSALISTQNGAAVRYYSGEEIAPGTKIVSIEPGLITLRRNGQDEILKLPLLSDKSSRAPTVSQHLVQSASTDSMPLAIARTHRDSQIANQRKNKLKARLEKLRTQKRND